MMRTRIEAAAKQPVAFESVFKSISNPIPFPRPLSTLPYLVPTGSIFQTVYILLFYFPRFLIQQSLEVPNPSSIYPAQQDTTRIPARLTAQLHIPIQLQDTE
jgi:hypothetical protein